MDDEAVKLCTYLLELKQVKKVVRLFLLLRGYTPPMRRLERETSRTMGRAR